MIVAIHEKLSVLVDGGLDGKNPSHSEAKGAQSIFEWGSAENEGLANRREDNENSVDQVQRKRTDENLPFQPSGPMVARTGQQLVLPEIPQVLQTSAAAKPIDPITPSFPMPSVSELPAVLASLCEQLEFICKAEEESMLRASRELSEARQQSRALRDLQHASLTASGCLPESAQVPLHMLQKHAHDRLSAVSNRQQLERITAEEGSRSGDLINSLAVCAVKPQVVSQMNVHTSGIPGIGIASEPKAASEPQRDNGNLDWLMCTPCGRNERQRSQMIQISTFR